MIDWLSPNILEILNIIALAINALVHYVRTQRP
jgi:hypothetical protein